jgi:2-polyprenyl-3-methyl-5-hydroxy-6-metoxy-1,4-benzoquinol methylase
MKFPLHKVQCETCGLLSNYRDLDSETLNEFYKTRYMLAERADQSEPAFFVNGNEIKRSDVIGDWFSTFIRRMSPSVEGRSFLEIGCGEGKLLQSLKRHFPTSEFYGLEPNITACDLARKEGVKVFNCGYDELQSGKKFDIVYSFAVFEHLPDPKHFLQFAAKILADGGILVMSQPCQDIPSHDLYFVDHLHHFHSQHVVSLAEQSGLKHLHTDVGTSLIPAFSMHAFTPSPLTSKKIDLKAPKDFDIKHNISIWEQRIQGFRKLINNRTEQKICVWGVGEIFSLLSIYGELRTGDIVAGFDNNSQRYEGTHSFPVLYPTLENVKSYKNCMWLLTFNPSNNIIDLLERNDIDYISLENLK